MAKIIIVGAGAAGLFACAHALALGHSVSVVEHMPSPGKKLLITGKGRCNLTNACTTDEFMANVRHNPRFLFSAIRSLPPQNVMDMFEAWGVPLKVERGRRVFPVSDRAADVLAALLQQCKGATMVQGEVQALLLKGGICTGVKLANGSKLYGDAVLVATGGLSYPVTGSTGGGYRLAKQAGHAVVAPVPSLVSLVEKGSLAKQMMGVSLRNVTLTLLCDNKPVFKEQGEMLFTHFGLSGPLVLSASAYMEDLQKHSYVAVIDLKPALSAEQLDARMQRDFFELSGKKAASALDKLAPAKMRPVLIKLWGVNPQTPISQITKQQRRSLVELLKHLPVPIAGRGDLAHAVITAGGVDVKQINPKTMESKLVPGLFFAGEVLDVDAYTGGYNLQIAWCTAYAAAQAF